MEEQEQTLEDYLAILSRRKVLMIVTMMLVFAVGLVVAIAWPPTYKSSATILIKEQEIPSELVQSTVTSYAAQRIQTISQRVMTRSNLMQIIEKYNLYVKDRKKYTTEEVLEVMRSDIGLNMISADVVDPRTGRPGVATIAFTLSFLSDNPTSAQRVAGELTSLFLAENLKTRKEKASETYLFLTEESAKLSAIISEQEQKLANYKKLNAKSLPDMSTMNSAMLDRAERELVQLDSDLSSNEERMFYLESQLAQTNPLTNMRSATGQSILDPVSRLKSLESEYASISARYSDEHPDVIKIKREIEGLRLQTGSSEDIVDKAKKLSAIRSELASLTKKYSPDHPDVLKLKKSVMSLEKDIEKGRRLPEQVVMEMQPDNPLYLSLKAQVQGLKSEIKAINDRKVQLKVKLAEYEQRILKAPEIEREYLELTREQANTTMRFQEIKAKQMQAEIAQELEKESKGESFVLIDPAQMPEDPIKPNRKIIVFLSLVLSIFSALGLAFVLEGIDSSVRSVRGVSNVISSFPLAVIPVIYNSQDYMRKKRETQLILSSVLTGFLVVVLLIHFFWMPLDVLWFKSVRKAENVLDI
ncbi:MAG: Wzz/FepE/Etk N-terminal domain-containing protein [Gammaproteobacteria bacterium]|nr:Wzz/FepE/Etk N-terminal domain-containing protein [Gammaproteobacteria bacterium]